MLSELLLTDLARLGQQGDLPLHRQLYEALRRAILDGKLAAGDRLPSSRELTQDLNLSRNTVVAAINQLSVEGYLVSRVGSGTFVNDSVPRPVSLRQPQSGRAGNRLSQRGQALASTFAPTNSKFSLSPPVSPTSAPFRLHCGSACRTSIGA